ncbi:MAG: YtxH domain-containing protein [Gemmatimonadota bacterium]|nr:YtxH domain-containing protein [Gemmatimonadota bacterium]MDH3422982.1 YtxH domain-containing protein [Gemmatimonadota bacterium]
MDYDHERQVANFLSGLLLGAVIGASVALLTAPRQGRKTRKRLKRAAVDIRGTAADRLDRLADEVKGKVDEVVQGARGRLQS